MRVSVVMPVYNRRGVIARAVQSVLLQEGVDFELILVDDASPDPDEELYQEVLRLGHQVLRRSENRGPGAARNAGVEQASGEWLAFLDSDDHWLPGKLYHHLQSLEHSGLTIGQTDEIWYRDGQRVSPPKAHRIGGGDLFARSLRAVCVSSSTVMLKRRLFEEMGGFDESLFVCEDYDLWLRAAAREHFDYCTEALVVKFGGHQDQLSRALPAMDRFRILAILKALQRGEFSRNKEQETMAVFELKRKLRILNKGSAKRGLDEVIELCTQIHSLLEGSHYNEALEQARKLAKQWPMRP